MRRIFAALVVLMLPVAALAQAPVASTADADRAAILATVQKFFDTMADRDVEGARQVLVPEGRFFVPVPGRETMRTFTNQEYLERLPRQKADVRERFWDPVVNVHGPIAVVWTPYDFWSGGKFSHCGVDAFNLVKTANGWKIAGGSYTVERTGCTPSPLGPLE